MPFAAMWMHLETVIPRKSDRGEIQYDIPYMWNLTINDTNELTKQKETHRLKRTNLWISVGKVGRMRQLGSLGWTCVHCYF